MKLATVILIVLALSLLLAACAQQDAATSTPANVEMTVRVEPEPLAVGETTLIVALRDVSDSPIDGASLQVHGDMDHEGMTPVDREVSESVDGEYRVPFEWTMGGGWIIMITARLPNNGDEITKTFDFFVEAVSSDSIINRQNNMDMNADATAESSMNMPEDTEVNIAYQPDKNPAHGGDAIVTITLTDRDSNRITDARVEVTGDMAHEGMMPVSGEGEHTGSGQYIVPLHWTMAGDWLVTVRVHLADGSSLERRFEQEVIVTGN